MMKIYDKKLAYPYFVWMVLFTVVPLFIVVYYAMTDAEGNFTLNNLTSISGYGSVFARSLLLALIATVICLVIAFPVGYFLSRLRVNKQHIMLMLVMLPMWMNFLLRTYAWMGLLSINGPVNAVLGFFNAVCQVYTTIIRGTPMMVQLLIMYYIILVALDNKILVAVIAFGLNSAAYVAEIVRSGIMSVDEGQFEAGRSLGLNYTQTMRLIILPQAFKNVLPALANEFITLLKETSISGYIAIPDLTKGGDIIRSQTYDAFLPLFGVAVIYLVLVMILTAGVHKLETRLRTNER